MTFDNGFKSEWEMFMRSLYTDKPFHWNLREGAKGVRWQRQPCRAGTNGAGST